MASLIVLILFLVAVQFVVTLPVVAREWSILRFFIAGTVSFFAVTLPLLVFFLSAFLAPDSKEACQHGWLDCFISGKLILTPVAFFATASIYAVEVLRVERCASNWIVAGICLGAILAWICFIHGLIVFGSGDNVIRAWLLVPFYIAVWYSIRAGQLTKGSPHAGKTCFLSFLASLPFWVGSYFCARNIFASLPDKSPDCFIVTAAGRGHKSLVGPFIEITRNGRRLRANQQLLTFWEFEVQWLARLPRTHARFRRVYNLVGPLIAAQIKSPWRADVMCLALKPLELVARWINHNLKD
jgi:hypothetical protein